jgi:hypothetical protein
LGLYAWKGFRIRGSRCNTGHSIAAPWAWRLELHPPDGLVFCRDVFDEEEVRAFLEVGIVVSPFMRVTFQGCTGSLFGCEEVGEG